MKLGGIIALAVLGAVLLTGCGKEKEKEATEEPVQTFEYNEKFSGTVTERFTEDEVEYLRLSVLGGEEIVVSIGKDCTVTGSKRLWTGDYVELECASSTADDKRSATSINITAKGSVGGTVSAYANSGNRMFVVTAATGESYGFVISEHTTLNWNAPVPGAGEGEYYAVSWDDFGTNLSVTVDADKAISSPSLAELPNVREWYSAKRVTVTDIPSGWFERPAEGEQG